MFGRGSGGSCLSAEVGDEVRKAVAGAKDRGVGYAGSAIEVGS